MFEHLIKALNDLNENPGWAGFTQGNGTISLDRIEHSDVPGPVYQLLAGSLRNMLSQELLQAGRTDADWKEFNSVARRGLLSVRREMFEREGFPIQEITLLGNKHWVVKTKWGLLLAD